MLAGFALAKPAEAGPTMAAAALTAMTRMLLTGFRVRTCLIRASLIRVF
jgi:hypothetical protein